MANALLSPEHRYHHNREYLDYVINQLIELADKLDADPDSEDDGTLEPYLAGLTGNSDDLEGNLAGSVDELEQDHAVMDQPGFIWGGQGA